MKLKWVWQTVQGDLSPLRETALQILADLERGEQAGRADLLTLGICIEAGEEYTDHARTLVV